VSVFTYSFQDQSAVISGYGGSINLGAGSGVAEEGFTVAANGDVNKMIIGADGVGMHILIKNYSGKITVRLLKTSPMNAALMQMYSLQRASSSTWGANTFSTGNTNLGDKIVAERVAFSKTPDISYSKESSEMVEWEFDSPNITITLGNGK
jgi:hypothetical protein